MSGRDLTKEDIVSEEQELLNKIDSFKKRRFTKEQVLRMGLIKKDFLEKHW